MYTDQTTQFTIMQNMILKLSRELTEVERIQLADETFREVAIDNYDEYVRLPKLKIMITDQ
jgi:hypothetical protein